MASTYQISIIGTGNLAWHLAPALENAGHGISEIYGRSPDKAEALAERLYNATAVSDLDFSQSNAEIVLIAVSDDSIYDIATEIVLPENAILAHTAGSRSMNELQYAACENIGVFYPLQTFTKGRQIDFEQVTMLVEGANKETQNALTALANSMCKRVHIANSASRIKIHMAAVFSCNFTNYMYRVASELLEDEALDLKILYPLIAETVNKAMTIGPDRAQTGPAVRGDMDVLNNHRTQLEDTKWLQLYNLVSNLIYEDGVLREE